MTYRVIIKVSFYKYYFDYDNFFDATTFATMARGHFSGESDITDPSMSVCIEFIKREQE